jgi:dihydrodipicolinate synthase/N-acetylneuraminate lyase
VRAAYEYQCEFVESTGAQVVVMASRALATLATSADDYREVYGAVLRQLERPAIIHWLGEMFDPALAGYWGDDPDEVVLDIVAGGNVDGVKISLLDAQREVALRERLPAGVRLYTGDDFNYPELIASGSDALLGIFAAIAPAAAAALQALEAGDRAEYDRILAPTVPLARKLFEPPTFNYKAGIAYLAWLNGQQEHFRMLGGMETARSPQHLAEVRELAERAGVA